jgi:hypothetical protein
VDYKGALVYQQRVMLLPEPKFKMRKGTVPSEYLYNHCKNEASDMDELDSTKPLPEKRSKEQEYDPQKMDKDSKICC